MLEDQFGLCAICLSPETITSKRTGRVYDLAVDHCHETGVIRGLLCNACNVGIGKFGDRVEMMKRAIDYLENSYVR